MDGWVLATADLHVRVASASPLATVTRPDGTVLSAELSAPTFVPEEECGAKGGAGGAITGGCLRAWRSLQDGEDLFGGGVQLYSGEHPFSEACGHMPCYVDCTVHTLHHCLAPCIYTTALHRPSATGEPSVSANECHRGGGRVVAYGGTPLLFHKRLRLPGQHPRVHVL